MSGLPIFCSFLCVMFTEYIILFPMVMKVDKSNKRPHTGFLRLNCNTSFPSISKDWNPKLQKKIKNHKLSLIYQVE